MIRAARLSCPLALALSAIASFAHAQGPVQVTVGQPNVWSLEQAHYLLAQMHEQSALMKAKSLDEGDLDPTAIHGSRLDLLRTAMSLQVSSDQQAGLHNRAALDSYEYETVRRRRQQARLDRLRGRQVTVAREIADLEHQLLLASREAEEIGGDGTGASTEPLESALAARQAEKAALDAEVTALSTEVSGSPPALGDLRSPAGLDREPPGLDGAVVEKLVENALEGAPSPRLQASMALDAYVQLQYEIIAKQLTLLRDEAGPDSRVLFLELPQSIYTAHRRGKDVLVRIRWRLAGYCAENGMGHQDAPPACDPGRSALAQRRKNRQPKAAGKEPRFANSEPKTFDELCADCDYRSLRDDRPEMHTIELIPRSAALNVNAVNGGVRSWNLGALLSRLGFGVNASYQRQRELFDQFVNQDVFASSYGRGASEFGWTFGPKPGTRRIAPGDHTTYAVAAVPDDATLVFLEADATCFGRRRDPDDGFSCLQGERRSFSLIVPREDTLGFWLDRVDYSSVHPGERITVFLRGSNFSPQIGVLVNGTPLEQVVRLTDFDGGMAAAYGPDGVFERVDADTLVLAFSMGSGYVGTPHITLTTPAKTAPINYFKGLKVNGVRRAERFDRFARQSPMFRLAPRIESLRLGASVKLSCETGQQGATIEGSGMRSSADIYVNDAKVDKAHRLLLTPQRYALCIPREMTSTHWRLRYFDHSTQRPDEVETVVPSPFLPSVTSAVVLERSPVFRLHLRGYGLAAVAQVRALGQGSADCTVVDPGVHNVSDQALDATLATEPKPAIVELCTEHGLRTLVDLRKPPAGPQILRLVNAETGTARGSTAGGFLVEIHGSNLGAVESVTFDGKSAKIVHPGGKLIQVKAPAAAGSGPARVRLLAANPDGPTLDNDADGQGAVFTYVEPPKKES